MNSNTIFELASMVYLQDVQLDVCVYIYSLLFKIYIYFFLFKMKLEVLCPFSRCYILYYKWLLSFSNQHTSVAEKLAAR